MIPAWACGSLKNLIHVRAKATAGLSNYSHELLIVSDRATSIGKVDMMKKERGREGASERMLLVIQRHVVQTL